MDIHKGSLITKMGGKKVKWQFFQIKFSPGHRNYSSWCLSNHKMGHRLPPWWQGGWATSWIWASIFQLGNWGLPSEQLQDPMLYLCRFTCSSWLFPQIIECSKCGILHSLQFFILLWTYSFCHTALQNLPLKERGICLTPWLWVGPYDLFNKVIQKCQGASSEALRGLVCSHMPSCASIITIRRACPG